MRRHDGDGGACGAAPSHSAGAPSRAGSESVWSPRRSHSFVHSSPDFEAPGTSDDPGQVGAGRCRARTALQRPTSSASPGGADMHARPVRLARRLLQTASPRPASRRCRSTVAARGYTPRQRPQRLPRTPILLVTAVRRSPNIDASRIAVGFSWAGWSAWVPPSACIQHLRTGPPSRDVPLSCGTRGTTPRCSNLVSRRRVSASSGSTSRAPGADRVH